MKIAGNGFFESGHAWDWVKLHHAAEQAENPRISKEPLEREAKPCA